MEEKEKEMKVAPRKMEMPMPTPTKTEAWWRRHWGWLGKGEKTTIQILAIILINCWITY